MSLFAYFASIGSLSRYFLMSIPSPLESISVRRNERLSALTDRTLSDPESRLYVSFSSLVCLLHPDPDRSKAVQFIQPDVNYHRISDLNLSDKKQSGMSLRDVMKSNCSSVPEAVLSSVLSNVSIVVWSAVKQSDLTHEQTDDGTVINSDVEDVVNPFSRTKIVDACRLLYCL